MKYCGYLLLISKVCKLKSPFSLPTFFFSGKTSLLFLQKISYLNLNVTICYEKLLQNNLSKAMQLFKKIWIDMNKQKNDADKDKDKLVNMKISVCEPIFIYF